MQPVINKVVIYATWRARLLVFLQPDYPAAGLQVPAGTVERDESVEAAAAREFREETSLQENPLFVPVGVHDYPSGNLPGVQVHRRHFFHAELVGPHPEQ